MKCELLVKSGYRESIISSSANNVYGRTSKIQCFNIANEHNIALDVAPVLAFRRYSLDVGPVPF